MGVRVGNFERLRIPAIAPEGWCADGDMYRVIGERGTATAMKPLSGAPSS